MLLKAVAESRPFSAIRIGDGEVNFISFGHYPGMPNLDHHVAEALVLRQRDSFRIDDAWMIVLHDLMMGAVAQADLVGILGLHLTREQPADCEMADFLSLPRASHGQFRGRQIMPEYARAGLLDGKLIASAHYYFGILANFDRLLAAVDKVLLVTSQLRLHKRLQRKYPDKKFDLLPVGKKDDA